MSKEIEDLKKYIEEELTTLHNKVSAMNVYYAKTVTVVNDQLDLIKSTNDKIKDIWMSVCEEDVDKAIELHNKKILKKAPKKKIAKKRAVKK